jgi:hypothetical protein
VLDPIPRALPISQRGAGEPLGVRFRQKGGKWYVFINHHGQCKASG